MFPDKIYKRYSEEITGATSAKALCKFLYGYLILKVIASASLWPALLRYYPARIHPGLFQRVLFFPAQWATHHLSLFCAIVLVAAFISVLVRLNYVSALFLFWMVININKINYPVSNGADFLLVVMFGLAVPLCHFPVSGKEGIRSLQIMLYNFAFLLCRVHLAMIYLASGWDKLINPVWRSGQAVDYVSKLDFLFMPDFAVDISSHPLLNFVISWLVILFELSFPVLVWFRKTKNWVLGAGVIFHLLIAIFLSLPDFGFLMIGLYVIFLRPEDWMRLNNFFKRWVKRPLARTGSGILK